MKIAIILKENGAYPAVRIEITGGHPDTIIRSRDIGRFDYLISSLIEARVRAFGDNLNFQFYHPAHDEVEL